MSLHNIGDMVATYTDTKMKHHTVGWINELVHEIIWHGDIDSRKLRYKIECRGQRRYSSVIFRRRNRTNENGI